MIFFDGIQYITYLEKWINRIYGFEEVKTGITGSNATVLSREITSKLIGRNVAMSLILLG